MASRSDDLVFTIEPEYLGDSAVSVAVELTDLSAFPLSVVNLSISDFH